MKTEPSEYSFDDLVREGRAVWSGVTNPAALIQCRAVKKGDRAFIYHTGDERAIVGTARIVSGAYEDPEHPGLNAAGAPKRAVFDVVAGKRAKAPLTLEAIKGDKRFDVAGFELVRLPRLSVMGVPEGVAALIQRMTGT